MTREEMIHEWKNKALIMCNADNCILDVNGNIAKPTVEALQALINVKGHAFYFGMMSYRPVMQVKKIYDTMELRPTSYLIGTKGAEVYSLSSDQFMIHQFIDPKTAQKIYDELIAISKHNSKRRSLRISSRILSLSRAHSSRYSVSVMPARWRIAFITS